MRPGLFPSQQRAIRQAFKKAEKLDHFRQRTRRAFLGLGALALGMGVGGYAVGKLMSSPVTRLGHDPRLTSRVDQGRRMAAQPDPILRRDHATLLLIIEGVGADDAMWVGFARLAHMALANQDAEDRQLARRLLTTAEQVSPPAYLQPLVESLRRMR
jgi:hypothetical protein